jgi:hypothetical protein
MNILSRIDAIAQSCFAKTSEMFRKPSEAVSEGLPNDSETTPTKLLPNAVPNSVPNSAPSDHRTKPRTQKQIEAYKKNFTNRHKPSAKSEPSHNKRLKSFLNEVYNKMSVFDPNKDYTKTNDDVSIYDTVVEVQKILQEITTLLQQPDETDSSSIESPPPQPKKRQVKPRQQPTKSNRATKTHSRATKHIRQCIQLIF